MYIYIYIYIKVVIWLITGNALKHIKNRLKLTANENEIEKKKLVSRLC